MNLKAFNESKAKNFSMYSKDSATNIFQQSTYYSNSINNKTILNKINFNNLSNIKKLSRKINKNKTSIMDKTKFNFSFNRIPFSETNNTMKSVFHNLDSKYKSYLDDPKKNSTDNIYSICKKIDNKKYTRNKIEYINMINNYIKSKKKNSSSIHKEMDLKETFSFFHNIKNKSRENKLDFYSSEKIKKMTKIRQKAHNKNLSNNKNGNKFYPNNINKNQKINNLKSNNFKVQQVKGRNEIKKPIKNNLVSNTINVNNSHINNKNNPLTLNKIPSFGPGSEPDIHNPLYFD
jgi:hypothetical protein